MPDPIPGVSDAPPANLPMSVELARALAEAADGFAGYGPRAFLVCPYEPEQKTSGAGFRVSGPYDDWEQVPEPVKWQVYDGYAGFFGPFDLHYVEPVHGARVCDVTFHTQEGDFHLPMAHTDALFFSTRAVEKFAQPYYERIFGPEFAAQLITHFQNANVQVMGHFPWTEYADGTRALNVPMVLRRDEAGAAMFAPLHPGVPPVHVRRVEAPKHY